MARELTCMVLVSKRRRCDQPAQFERSGTGIVYCAEHARRLSSNWTGLMLKEVSAMILPPRTVDEYAALLARDICPLCLGEHMTEDDLGGQWCRNCHAPEGSCPRPGCGGVLEGWDWPEAMQGGKAVCSEGCGWPGPDSNTQRSDG